MWIVTIDVLNKQRVHTFDTLEEANKCYEKTKKWHEQMINVDEKDYEGICLAEVKQSFAGVQSMFLKDI